MRRKFEMCRPCAPMARPPREQRGVVLLVVLILLLLTTVISFVVMETSSLESRMAVAREGREVSFQAAESALNQARSDQAFLVNAFVAGLNGALIDPNSVPWPTRSYSYGADAALNGNVETRYVDEIPALGNDIVIGNPGLRSLHFELRAAIQRGDEKYDSNHIQGIKRFAPKLP